MSLLVVLVFLFVLGLDPFYLKFHWFPYLLLSFKKLRESVSKGSVAITLLFAVLFSTSAGTMGFFGSLIAWGGSAFLVGEKRELVGGHVVNATGLFILLLSVFLVPYYEMPDYPGDARFATPSPLQFLPSPLVGPALQPNPVDFSAYLSSCRIFLFRYGLFFLFAFFSFCGKPLFTKKISGMMVAAFAALAVPLFFLSFELYLFSVFPNYSPFRMLQRIVPGVGLVEIPWLFIPVFVIFGLSLTTQFFSFRSLMAVFVLYGSLGFCFAFLGRDFNALWGESPDHFRSKEASKREVIMNSPSRLVIETYGEWILEDGISSRRDRAHVKKLDLHADFEVTITASPPENAELALDERSSSRWHTRRPQQPGDYLDLEFDRPLTVVQVELLVKNLKHDFPRGIKVSASHDLKTYFDLVSQPIWYGPVQWTPTGFPYFGKLSRVVIDFPKAETVRRLRFTQMLKEEHFEWSIYEVELFTERAATSVTTLGSLGN